MEVIGIDFETYFASGYTLSSMSCEAYVRDPRFEMIMASLQFRGDAPAQWMLRDKFEHVVEHEIDWSDTVLIAQNAAFDGLILAHHFGKHPAMWIDTLSMANAICGPRAGNSLAKLAERFKVGVKGEATKWAFGKRLADFTKEQLFEYGRYCCNDTELTYKLAEIMIPQMPADELKLIDLTINMFTTPALVGDQEKLRDAVASERARKKELLMSLGYGCKVCNGEGKYFDLATDQFTSIPCKTCDGAGVDKKPFASSDKFAAILRSVGVEPETKTSNTTGEQIYAFARTDSAMQSLLDDPDDVVRALAEARCAVKSTIVETRAQRFLNMAERGPLPVALKYHGAHTMRWSGSDGSNFQNLSGQNSNRPEMATLKKSISAPLGHKIVCADSSQGEARLLAWQAGQHDLTAAFSQGRDVYSEFASVVYGRPIDRKRVKEDHIPGQVGKISILSFGFGAGWYRASMEFLKGALGNPPLQFKQSDMDMMGIDPSAFLNSPKKLARVDSMPSRLEFNPRLIHCIVVDALIKRYRAKQQAIMDYWALQDQVIDAMVSGQEIVFGAHGIMRTGKGCIWMPNGLPLRYPHLERDAEGNASYFDGRARTKLYPSLLVENETQCLHRIVVAEQMLQIADVVRVVSMTHDDVIVAVPEAAAELTLEFMVKVMSTTPSWAAGLPLAAEGWVADNLLGGK